LLVRLNHNHARDLRWTYFFAGHESIAHLFRRYTRGSRRDKKRRFGPKQEEILSSFGDFAECALLFGVFFHMAAVQTIMDIDLQRADDDKSSSSSLFPLAK
jgi:hypothetical protein